MTISSYSQGTDGSVVKKPPLISKGWIQGAILVLLFGFLVLGISGYRTYSASMPIPKQVVNEQNQLLFTDSDITKGQEIFLGRGLMQYGSILGHGAYLGPDYTAEYLHLATDNVSQQLREAGVKDLHESVVKEFRTNRYDSHTGVLVYTDHQARAYQDIEKHYAEFFGDPTTRHGLFPEAITDPQDIHNLTAFFSWTAWSASAQRPGHSYTYTNNWPYETAVDNGPSADLIVWSALSLIMLIGGIGAIFTVYGRWNQKIGWHASESRSLIFRRPGTVPLTPAQRATAFFFLIVGVLFLAQTLLGGVLQHYRSDLTNFYGIDLARILPFNLARTWHMQLSLFWIVASFLAAGIFITAYIAAGKPEPKHQATLTYALLGALAIVVFGSLACEGLSLYKVIPSGSFFSQQWEWLDLPHLFQILLCVGLFLWIFIVWRGVRSSLANESKTNMPWLFFFTGLAIPAFYTVGLLAKSDTHVAVADYWRFWVVHLWVEDFLELFTTAMVAYIFVLLGVVRQQVAVRLIFLDVILYSCGGMIGTLHHLYFSGTPVEDMALGAVFSAGEVIPLTFLTVEAWTFLQLGARQHSTKGGPFPHRWAVMFLVAVGFWNFVGAGIFGFLINLPIVSYYEIGTGLTANHAHAAMFGVYGMLALGCALFALRYIIPADKWPEKCAKVSFWCCNIGLVWMVFATLLPLGVLQLYHSVSHGYFSARDLGYITKPGNSIIEWIRMPGDLMIIFGGAVPFLWIAFTGVKNFKSAPKATEQTLEKGGHLLYADAENSPEQDFAGTGAY